MFYTAVTCFHKINDCFIKQLKSNKMEKEFKESYQRMFICAVETWGKWYKTLRKFSTHATAKSIYEIFHRKWLSGIHSYQVGICSKHRLMCFFMLCAWVTVCNWYLLPFAWFRFIKKMLHVLDLSWSYIEWIGSLNEWQ